MMISTNNIFTIQTDRKNKANIVRIETLITNGLYRFTLLGMHVKYASDTKDRVYSALRSSNLLNLKSDNRKIIVNFLPDDTDKKEGLYDLGIALSLLSCLDKKLPENSVLALGGLSITGKITPSLRLKQGIYTAYKNNIQLIICSTEDLKYVHKADVVQLKRFGIQILCAETLKEAVELLKHVVFNTVNHGSEFSRKNLPALSNKNTFSNLDSFTRALVVSLCGGHHILIQTALTGTIRQYCEQITMITGNQQTFGLDLYTAFQDNTTDDSILLQNTFIENIKNVNKNSLLSLQTTHRNSIFALYTPCTCGYQYGFFESNRQERKCICSQRTILQHKRYIESNYFDVFNMHITNTQNEFPAVSELENLLTIVKQYQFKRHVTEHNLTPRDIYLFPDNSFLNQYRDISKIEDTLSIEARSIWMESKHEKKILRVAQTIQDILDITENDQTKKLAISKQALVLALSYIPKMDF